jgi:hypothetical protein
MANKQAFDDRTTRKVSVETTFNWNIEQSRKIGERIDKRFVKIDEIGKKTDEWLDKWLNRKVHPDQ